ncbi:MAG TPA: shikimate dehydrogenase [Chlamydiales bacterium]|nr:shikimate dehydrogenase [Chlamydiales bacterium]
MLVAVIKDPKDVEKAIPYADALEFRLDYSLKLVELRSKVKQKKLFTLRKKEHGGVYQKSEEERLKELEHLASLKPDFLDIESDVPLSFLKKIRDLYPEIQLIISHHDFEKTPDLFALLQEMEKPFYAIYKIACKANSASDLLRMLSFIRKTSKEKKIIGISMGEYGEPSRVLGKIMGNYFSYASIEKEQGVLYQLTIEELHKIYHFPDLNSSTQIFALLGDPIEQSVGPIFHNRIFHERKQNAVYVKCKAKQEEVGEFFKASLFQGFSITMPLKEAVIPFLDHIDLDAKKIGAVNTVVKKDGKYVGYNTDAPGALDALEEESFVRGRKLIIIGTGGTTRAIAYEAKKRGSEVYIAGRSKEKAEAIAKEFSCHAVLLNQLPTYDILINATPVGMKEELLPIPESEIRPETIIMDTIYSPSFTPLLQAAQKKNCICVFGFSMFENQALLQQKLWFS